MSIFLHNFKYKFLEKNNIEHQPNIIMAWSLFKKAMLIPVCGLCLNLQWISWKVFAQLTGKSIFTNQLVLEQQIKLNLLFIIIFSILIIIPFYLRFNTLFKKVFPYIVATLFTFSLCREIYLVGVLNPSTMIIYVCLLYTGRIIFPRNFIYLFFIPITCFLMVCCYCIFTQYIPYGPIFHIDKFRYTNLFWLSTIIYLIVPILLISLAFFEFLLQQQHLQEQLIHKLSYLDPLTNLANRRTINTCLQQLSQSELTDYCIVLLDLDYFKEVNDRYGHHTGDQVLVKIADILKAHIQPYDLAGRFGGEEFILVLKHTSLAIAEQTALQCKTAIEHTQMYSEETQQYFFITSSFGVAMAEEHLPPQQVLSYADQALYQAKFSGRNQVKTFTATL